MEATKLPVPLRAEYMSNAFERLWIERNMIKTWRNLPLGNKTKTKPAHTNFPKCLIPYLICFKSPVDTPWVSVQFTKALCTLWSSTQQPCLYSLAPLATADWMRGGTQGDLDQSEFLPREFGIRTKKKYNN